MTNQLTSKFSLYDILSMILPGCIWLWILEICCSNNLDWVKKLPGMENDFWFGMAFLALAYIIGIVGEVIFGWVWSKTLANMECHITKIYKSAKYEMVDGIKVKNIKEKYYVAYEYVRQKSVNIEVFSIESQIAMLRNIVFPLSIFVGMVVAQNYCLYKAITSCIFCLALLIFIMLRRQSRKYQLVFDCYEYMKRLENLDLCKFE